MITTALTRLLGIRHPILSAPMAAVAGGELARAVSAAGGFGMVGGGYGDPQWCDEALDAVGEIPAGIGFITWRLAERPELLRQALDRHPRAVFLSFGDIEPFVADIKAAGAMLIVQVQSVAAAAQVANLGADIIVAQGAEAGGHGASRATLPLVPAVVDAVDPIPVAAGGRGLAAALMLGASGAVMGSRFYACQESLARQKAKSIAVASSGDDTIRSPVFDVLRGFDWPRPYALKTLKNRMTERWSADIDGLRVNAADEIVAFDKALEDEDFDLAPVVVGEVLDLIRNLPSAAEIIDSVVADAEMRLRAAPGITLAD